MEYDTAVSSYQGHGISRFLKNWSKESKRDANAHAQSDKYGRNWACDNCGDAGMSVYVDRCTQCDHIRCDYCPVEWVEFLNVESSISIPETILGGEPACQDNVSVSRTLFTTNRSQNHGQLLSRFAIKRETSNSPLQTPDLTPSANSTRISALTPENFSPASLFSSPIGYPDSNTDEGNSDSRFERDKSDHDTESRNTQYVLSLEESHVLSELGYDWRLAARRVTQGQSIFYSEPTKESGSPGEDFIWKSPEGLKTHGNTRNGSSSSTTEHLYSSGTTGRGSDSRKRGREQTKRSENPKDHKTFKKGKRDPSESSNGEDQHLYSDMQWTSRPFACPFHKYDPGRYGPWGGKDFKQCQGLIIKKEFRHIKYHLKKHKQCDTCWSLSSEIQKDQANHSCLKVPKCAKESINEQQWTEIEAVLKKERPKKGTTKPQSPMEDVANWYRIWEILFPGIIPPLRPWSEPSSLDDVGQVLAALERIIAKKNQEGALPRVGEARFHLERLRETLKLELPGDIQILGQGMFEGPAQDQDFADQTSDQIRTTTDLDQSPVSTYKNSRPTSRSSEATLKPNLPPLELGSKPRLEPQAFPSISEQNSEKQNCASTIQAHGKQLLQQFDVTKIYPLDTQAGQKVIRDCPEVVQSSPDFGLDTNQESTDTFLETYLNFGNDEFVDFSTSYQASTSESRYRNLDFDLNEYHIDPEGNFEDDMIMSQLLIDNQESQPRMPMKKRSSEIAEENRYRAS